MSTVFISYSHTPISNKERTKKLADKLILCGLDVTLDKYDLCLGNDIDQFIQDISIDDLYSHILVICNADYYMKSKKIDTGVGKETHEISRIYNQDPYQSKILPVLMDVDSSEVKFPDYFLEGVYYVDLRKDESLESENMQSLINHLQGVHPVKPHQSELDILLSYALGKFPGLPKFLTGYIKQEIDRQIFNICDQTVSLMLSTRTWLNTIQEENALDKIYTDTSYFLDYIPDIDLVLQTHLLLWNYNDLMPDNRKCLELMETSLKISERFKEKGNYTGRTLYLKYHKAITLHRLNNIDQAFEIYEMLTSDDSQDILNQNGSIIHLYASLYKGHVYMLMKNSLLANIEYRNLIKTCEVAFKEILPPELVKNLYEIYYCAHYSISNRTIDEEIKLKGLEQTNDELFMIYMTNCRTYYPYQHMMRLILVPVQKPDIDGWTEGIHFKWL